MAPRLMLAFVVHMTSCVLCLHAAAQVTSDLPAMVGCKHIQLGQRCVTDANSGLSPYAAGPSASNATQHREFQAIGFAKVGHSSGRSNCLVHSTYVVHVCVYGAKHRENATSPSTASAMLYVLQRR